MFNKFGAWSAFVTLLIATALCCCPPPPEIGLTPSPTGRRVTLPSPWTPPSAQRCSTEARGRTITIFGLGDPVSLTGPDTRTAQGLPNSGRERNAKAGWALPFPPAWC